MRHLSRTSAVGFGVLALALAVTVYGLIAAAADDETYEPPRAADGHPDLNGIWQANNTAHWDLQDHATRPGPVPELGAAFGAPGGRGVVEGGEIPYQPWATEKKKENAANWIKLDPEVKCYLPGVPRATYMPYPFQVVQGQGDIAIAYQFANATRTIHMGEEIEGPVDTWMGWSTGRWEGDTLVVDVKSFNDRTWFDRAGNFHSDELRVTERYTRTGPDTLQYEATIQDPKVFTRPWTISMPLYRRVEPDAELVEYKCIELVEELVYGHLSKAQSAGK